MSSSDIIFKFYDAFVHADAKTMLSYYHDEIEFEDPAFGKLKGEDVKNMWRMLIERSKGELKITFDNVVADEKSGTAEWTAVYNFGQTGRAVTNKIKARFEFKDGKIFRHTDHFDMWRWSGQALGLTGYLLGWTSFFRNKIQKQTRKLLKSYSDKRI